ncbi:unnamed protein product [Brachionus calyciflorus]|uniref:G-protein coupled receptors family 1 profile domain-containing protein n=1 Tax=Brachionus calyciflorus TaxID=104777 RepID=A0A814BR33_9BILA|nr:unnamed protein product [Brachionus calyciflorus]
MDYTVLFFISILTVALIGLIGNIVVIIVYTFDKSLRSFTNYFFVNLSIVDILIVLVCLPVGLLDLLMEGAWILGEIACKLEFFIEAVLISVSSLTLISISIERFYAIFQPIHMNTLMSKKLSIIVLVMLWIISIIFSSPFIFNTVYRTDVAQNSSVSYCYNDRSYLFPKIYSSIFISVFVFIPSIILSIVYISLIHKIKSLNRCHLLARQLNVQKKKRQYSSIIQLNFFSVSKRPVSYDSLVVKRKQTITICLVSLAFFFCQIPIKIFQLFNVFYKFEKNDLESDILRFKVLNTIFLITKFLYFLHGMSNPIIYNLMSTKFNRSFRNVVLCKPISLTNRDYYLRHVSFSIQSKMVFSRNRLFSESLKSTNTRNLNHKMSLQESYG